MNNCPLCRAIREEEDNIVHKNSTVTYIKTKNMKGHHKRIMIVSNDHISYGDMDPWLEKVLLDEFVEFCEDYFDEEPTFALVESTYCTIPDHWHKIACDWFGTKKEIEQLHYTPHKSIPTLKKWRPEK